MTSQNFYRLEEIVLHVYTVVFLRPRATENLRGLLWSASNSTRFMHHEREIKYSREGSSYANVYDYRSIETFLIYKTSIQMFA